MHRGDSFHTVTRPFNNMVFQDHVKNRCYISTTTLPMTTKPGRVVTYNEELPSIKLQDPLTTWSCIVARLRYKLNTLFLHYHNDYGLRNVAGWLNTMRSFFPSHKISSSRGLARSRNKLNTLYLYSRVPNKRGGGLKQFFLTYKMNYNGRTCLAIIECIV